MMNFFTKLKLSKSAHLISDRFDVRALTFAFYEEQVYPDDLRDYRKTKKVIIKDCHQKALANDNVNQLIAKIITSPIELR